MEKDEDKKVEETPSTFLTQEYKFLQAEIAAFIKQIWLVENAAITGTAAVYAWLVQYGENLNGIMWFMPVMFAIFGYLRSKGLMIQLLHQSRYLQSLEQTLCQTETPPYGWQTEINAQRVKGGDKLIRSGVWLWPGLLFVNLLVGGIIVATPWLDSKLANQGLSLIVISILALIGAALLLQNIWKSVAQWKVIDAEVVNRLDLKKRNV